MLESCTHGQDSMSIQQAIYCDEHFWLWDDICPDLAGSTPKNHALTVGDRTILGTKVQHGEVRLMRWMH